MSFGHADEAISTLLENINIALETLNVMDERIVPVATAQAWRTEILAIRQEMIDAMGRFRQLD